MKNSNSDGSASGADFSFTGSCFSVHSGSTVPVDSVCTVSDDLTTIKFEYLGGYS